MIIIIIDWRRIDKQIFLPIKIRVNAWESSAHLFNAPINFIYKFIYNFVIDAICFFLLINKNERNKTKGVCNGNDNSNDKEPLFLPTAIGVYWEIKLFDTLPTTREFDLIPY